MTSWRCPKCSAVVIRAPHVSAEGECDGAVVYEDGAFVPVPCAADALVHPDGRVELVQPAPHATDYTPRTWNQAIDESWERAFASRPAAFPAASPQATPNDKE